MMTAFCVVASLIFLARVIARLIYLCDGKYPRERDGRSSADDTLAAIAYALLTAWGFWMVFA